MARELICRFFRVRSGTAAIEFALITPLMIALFGGVLEVGRAYQVYNAVNRLATQYAITWADCSDIPAGTCNSEASAYVTPQAIGNIAPQIQYGSLTLNMFQVTMVGTSPTVIYSIPSGATMNASQISAAQSVLTNGQSGIVVSAIYSHTLQYFQALMTPALANYLTPSYIVVQLKY